MDRGKFFVTFSEKVNCKGISYVSAMNTITGQRRRLDQMLAKVQVLKDNSASNGRSLAPMFKDPTSRVLKKVSIFIMKLLKNHPDSTSLPNLVAESFFYNPKGWYFQSAKYFLSPCF